ncbi:MAG: penicillin acylase family protein [Deltaproteobacteria bacterium]|nr:penicillin acylase family protein [Deltaproteobacteria bacterium]
MNPKILVPFSIIVVIGIGIIYLHHWLTLSCPSFQGEANVRGLKAPVEVYRDSYGVPHVYAQDPHDLFLAQGYVMAQDRLWQMDLLRRLGQGRLAEVFGEKALEMDLFARTIGLGREAKRDIMSISTESRIALRAFSNGVNAFIETHQDRLPLEFRLLGYRPGPWRPEDSLAISRVILLILARNAASEILRAQLSSCLGTNKAAELLPPYCPVHFPPDLPDVIHGKSSFSVIGGGSNNWVVDGVKSTTGMPLLANDPHLGVFLPSIWYENHLDGGGYRVIGVSFPGTPGVVIGHNERIAWGVTNMEADVQDLYWEQVCSHDPYLYLYKGRLEKMKVTKEEIWVKEKKDPIILEVRLTRHGPLIDHLIPGLVQPLALQWTSFEESCDELQAFLMLDRTQDWKGFRDALSHYQGAPQNFVYADKDGNIGYWGAGRIPIRSSDFGLYPVDGASGKYDWVGYIPFEELPHLYNPPEHFIATANNNPLGDHYPYYISLEWAPPFRIQRITKLLQAKERLSLLDFQEIQADVLSIPARILTPYLLKLDSSDPRIQEAQSYLRDWDFRFPVDSVPATIYQMALLHLLKKTFGDELGELLPQYLEIRYGLLNSPHQRGVELLVKIIDDPISPWFDDISTGTQEGRDDILLRSLQDTLEELERRLGPEMKDWRWGKLHRCLFRHPFGERWPLNYIFNLPPVPLMGEKYTINHAGFDPAHPFTVNTIASYRQVIDLGDLSRSVCVHPPGQSGHPLHPHYRDLLTLWSKGEYHPIYFYKRDVQAHSPHLLRLIPQNKVDDEEQ